VREIISQVALKIKYCGAACCDFCQRLALMAVLEQLFLQGERGINRHKARRR